jgi:cytoskeletal protein CcmA (bactofilin family)
MPSHSTFLDHFRKTCGAAVVALALLTGTNLIPSAFALEVRAGQGEGSRVLIPAGETVDDTLVAAGETVEVHGTITGNLIAAARAVIIRGKVEGDLIVAAQSVDLYGEADGNVLSACRRLDYRGQTGRSLHAFAEVIDIDRAAAVGGDAIVFGSEVSMDGVVGRDAFAFAGLTLVRGTVGRNMVARTGSLLLGPPARVGGNLTAHVPAEDQVQIDPGAKIGGETRTRVREPSERRSRFARAGFYLWQLLRLGAGFVSGLLLFALWPAVFVQPFDTAAGALRTMGVGFLVAVVTPVAALVAAITLVGLPVGLFTLALWLGALYASTVIVAALVGQAVRRGASPSLSSFAIALLLGLVVFLFVTSIPFLGVLVRLLAVLLGLGIILTQIRPALAARPPM